MCCKKNKQHIVMRFTMNYQRSHLFSAAVTIGLLVAWPVIGDDAATDAKFVIGPAKGSLIVHGGGKLQKELVERFITLAGGPEALIVVIPTAGTQDDFPADWGGMKFLANA